MSDEKKERRCKVCGKLLIDEKMPFCRRCVMEGRNKAGELGKLFGGIAITYLGAKGLGKNSNDVKD